MFVDPVPDTRLNVRLLGESVATAARVPTVTGVEDPVAPVETAAADRVISVGPLEVRV